MLDGVVGVQDCTDDRRPRFHLPFGKIIQTILNWRRRHVFYWQCAPKARIISGLLRLHSRYGPPDRSAAHTRPLSRGSNPCGYPHKPLVSAGKQSTRAPARSAGVVGAARRKGDSGNRGPHDRTFALDRLSTLTERRLCKIAHFS
jgi:hypothetical protein